MNIPSGYAQINYFLVGAALPRNAQIVIGVDHEGEIAVDDVAALCRDAFANNIMPLLPETVTLEKVKAKFGPNDTGDEYTITSGEPGGDDTGEAMSPNVAILVNKQTASGGKSNKGKMFIPAFVEGDTTGGGYLTEVALGAWAVACAGFYDDLVTADCPMVVLHTNELATPTPVTALNVQQKLATQKRRLRRAGGRRLT